MYDYSAFAGITGIAHFIEIIKDALCPTCLQMRQNPAFGGNEVCLFAR